LENEHLIGFAGPREPTTTVYRYSADGWQVSDLDEAADATYSDWPSSTGRGPDPAAAARALVFMALRF
jgi:hypothetical protein